MIRDLSEKNLNYKVGKNLWQEDYLRKLNILP